MKTTTKFDRERQQAIKYLNLVSAFVSSGLLNHKQVAAVNAASTKLLGEFTAELGRQGFLPNVSSQEGDDSDD